MCMWCPEAVWAVLEAQPCVTSLCESESMFCMCEILCRQPASARSRARCRRVFLESQLPLLLSWLTRLEERLLLLSPNCTEERQQ